MPVIAKTVLLLVLSNIFMTFAPVRRRLLRLPRVKG